MPSWQQQDQLGRTTLLRSYLPGGDERTLESKISLTYDGGQGRWQRLSSVDYDFLGRMRGRVQ